MLYRRKKGPLTEEEFASPSPEYRGAPFWAWNGKLERKELLRQIGELKKMGFGGFFMHTRSGLSTPYLGKEFMGHVKASVKEAEKQGIYAFLYDEDRWPSGAAGGEVTKDRALRAKFLVFDRARREEVFGRKAFSAYALKKGVRAPLPAVPENCGAAEGKTYLLAAYDLSFDENGDLTGSELILPDEEAKGEKWYAYVEVEGDLDWYNGQSYIDVMSRDAMERFLQLTHEKYFKEVGDAFGKTVPAVFTDEPQLRKIDRAPRALGKEKRRAPWTTDFPETFFRAYGYDAVPRLPEIFWDRADGFSTARYHYHDHAARRFADGFFKPYRAWCEKHGVLLTGHVMGESQLGSQSRQVGDAMRMYRDLDLPGIDMLKNNVELNTAKQCQSVLRQCGKSGMMSELYGVTGWDFDFRGHKFQGDWQAALGVTLRVPHLAWYNMKGCAKRDYPASIHYQSAWYREYPLIEDHFARLGAVLSRGKSVVRAAVLHPVESFWLLYGPLDRSRARCDAMETAFRNLTKWLLSGTIDFDFLCESTLPEDFSGAEDGLFHVGEMAYEAVIVPEILTMRGTTLRFLEEFQAAGGRVIVLGDAPEQIDAKPSPAAKALVEKAGRVPATRFGVLSALEDLRDVSLCTADGKEEQRYLYSLKEDGDDEWLFLAKFEKEDLFLRRRGPDTAKTALTLRVRGKKKITLFDTLTGKTAPLSARFAGDFTETSVAFYASDSLLLKLEETETETVFEPLPEKKQDTVIRFPDPVPYTLSEDNVMVLDRAEWSEDGVHFEEKEEILRIDTLLRKKYAYPEAGGSGVQPYVIASPPDRTVDLKFTFFSDGAYPCRLAFEEAEKVKWNGGKVKIERQGFFCDKAIRTMKLLPMKKGKNTLLVRVPFGKRDSLENLFLLGKFGVVTEGSRARIVSPQKKIAFGSLVHQGLPFYSGAVTYRLSFETKAADLLVRAPLYQGALISARLDGKEAGKIAFAPYSLALPRVPAGRHTLELTVFLSRVNSFGALHNTTDETWIDPRYWYTTGDAWSDEYRLLDGGILKSPEILVFPDESANGRT